MAGTGLDEHHALLHDLPIRTLEVHGKGGGSVWGATPPVCAHSAELGAVCLHAGAARELKLDRLGDFGGPDALFAFLRKTREEREINDSARGVAFCNLCVSPASNFCLYFEEGKFESHLPVFQK